MNDPPEEFGPTSDLPPQQATLASTLPYALAVPPKPPRVWTVFVLYVLCTTVGLGVGVGAFIVGMLIEQGPGAFRDPPQIESGPMPLLAFGLMFVALELVLFLGVIAATLLSPVRFCDRLRLRRSHISVLGYFVMLVGILAAGQTLESSMAILEIEPGSALEDMHEFITSVHGEALVIVALMMGLFAAFGEEFLCRGYIQTRLSRRWGSLSAVLITSLLFGILHFDVMHSTMAFFIGLYLGFLAERTGSIWPCIMCHALNNIISVFLTSLYPYGLARETHQSLLIAAVLLLILSTAYVLVVTPNRAR
ncbi:MAG: CPBP family intramembrane metalloprotease [Planctomycetes bacterium]|nr:CPBP family intramembrane metalloprotease [Planctomycetota bacterium]